jgi:archaellum biogenesis ATPase FlaH
MAKITRAVLPATECGNDPNDHREDPDYLDKLTTRDCMSWAEEYTFSDDDIAELRAPEWIIENILIRGHLLIVVAEPNAGKTTIFTHLADEMVAKGYRVFYVNADIAGSDAARFIEQARQGGWHAMLPDLRPGLSMADVVENLKNLNQQSEPLGDLVFIFDTLKKMTDVISKRQVKELLLLLRSLTGKGATIVALGHTNKYKDSDGKPIYEGTGDIRSDADELIYLIPQKHDDKSMTVSTEPDKVRGTFEPITFNISPNRQVTRASHYVDTAAQRKAHDRHEADLPEIEVILQTLDAGKVKQSEILEHCREHKIGKRAVLRILREYSRGTYQQWTAHRGFENNVIQYFRLERAGGKNGNSGNSGNSGKTQ